MFSDHGSPSLEGNLMVDTSQANHSVDLEGSPQAAPEGSARTKVSRKSDCHLSLAQQALENFQSLSQQVHHDVDERRHLMEEVHLTLQKALQELRLVRESMQKLLRSKIRGAPRRGPHRGAGLPHLATPHPHRPSPAFYTPYTTHVPWTPISSAVSAPASSDGKSFAELPSKSQHEAIN